MLVALCSLDTLDAVNKHSVDQLRHGNSKSFGQAVENRDELFVDLGRIHGYPLSISAVVALGLAVGVKNDGVTATIADDRLVASIQDETFSFVFLDEGTDRFPDFQGSRRCFLAFRGAFGFFRLGGHVVFARRHRPPPFAHRAVSL